MSPKNRTSRSIAPNTSSRKFQSPKPTRKQPRPPKKGIPSRLPDLKRARPAKRPVLPKTEMQFSALSSHAQDQWTLVTHVIQKMRTGGMSLTQAAKEYGIDRKKVVELGGSALRKQTNGRYKAKSFDRLLRVLVIPSKDGPQEVAVRDSRTASKLGSYSAAVQRFLQTGDKSKLIEFKKLRLKTADGKPFKLLTDTKELTRLGSAGVLSFESIYARVA
jgi:hypothetical protein